MPAARTPIAYVVAVAAVVAAAGLTGCVTIYEPLGGLQRPVVVDARMQNFKGAKVFVRCVPNKSFTPGDAADLCRRVSTLFTNQGAEVETTVPPDAEDQLVSFSTGKPDLVVDLTSRQVSDNSNGVMLILAELTCTLIPAIDEQSYIQEIAVRDGDGAVLSTSTLKSRFLNYYGCGVWSLNALLDFLVRKKEDALTGDGAQKDYSRDFYGQLSQTAFNALVRERLLGEGPMATAPLPPVPAAKPNVLVGGAAPAAATTTPAAATPAPPPAAKPKPKPAPLPPPPAAINPSDALPLPPVLGPPQQGGG